MSEKEQSVGTQLKPGMGSGGRVYEGRGKVWCGTHNRYELKEAYDGVRAGEVRAELHREGEVKDARGHGSERHPGTGSSMTVLQRMGWRPMKRSAAYIVRRKSSASVRSVAGASRTSASTRFRTFRAV